MEKFVEKLLERLEYYISHTNEDSEAHYAYKKCKEEVNQLAEEYMTCYKTCTECEAYDKEKHHCPKFCYIIAETVKEIEENHKGGWISVNDRLPTKEGSYLVVGKTGGATVTRWYEPSKFYPNGHFGGNSARYIRYWMPRPLAPLPEKYKEEQ